MPLKYWLLSILVFPLANAYPQIINPPAGTSLPGGVEFTVTWVDSGYPPMVTELTSYELFLYSGSNSNPQQLHLITTGTFSAGSSVSVTVPSDVGGSVANAYFLGLVSKSTEEKSFTSFSNRFTLTGMTGKFSASVQNSIDQVTGITGPKIMDREIPMGDVEAAGPWAIPYNLQQGLTKYAPMQPIPPTAITATNTNPLWQTSLVDFAKTYLPSPSQVTTLTQSQTFSTSSHANTASPAPQPHDDMQKFLGRWKD